jgi:hypothetical protein
VPVGSAADFAVVAIGGVGGYRWWKRVDGVDTEVVTAGSGPWLTIDKVAPSDGARYYVEVLNASPGGAPIKSEPVLLEVLPLGE